ncbi:glycosyl hydrolase family 81 [Fusarium mexicanum]|uniref:glucan endo-1,3-beta-D-glucosidase n=1 Tax=Fusarium mexicanum TaxID=751941 RepID=A0A8H5J3P2_9HYPO|nr:glycosyl hydrolase family 81 [Fusarium mexicanum]
MYIDLGNLQYIEPCLQRVVSKYYKFLLRQQSRAEPLCNDGVWKGLVSSASYRRNDCSIDFGNTYYNDHNFHYGYYVYTAANITHFDPSWLSKNGGVNKIWVNNLIRDWSNPSAEDPCFPFSRSFDSFPGHSWAQGALEAPDGKDPESLAKDAFSTYAIKMWGKVSGDASLEARGNLQLAVMARSLQLCFLLASDNIVQPADFVGNRATGVLWDKKISHKAYFGDEIAYIQGFHMLPIVPSSAYIRQPFSLYARNGIDISPATSLDFLGAAVSRVISIQIW